jgi:4-amino-4-deoxy-L-arabinose transferase-like glycosyltransferase
MLVSLFPDGWNTGHWPDAYHRLAQNMLDGNGFRFYPDTADTLFRMPGYPIILSMIFALFGKSIIAVQVFNVICSSIAAYIAMKIAISLSKSTFVGFLAAAITMFYPAVIISDGRGGPESLYMLTVIALLAILIRSVYSNKLIYYFYFGILLGVALLIKSTLAFLPATLLIYLFIKAKE